ncbi:MAG: alpha/beta hydrolase [Anaerolineales bacterium]
MSGPITLPLETASGTRLVHKYYGGDRDPGALLLALPGDHYGVDGPLLYYPTLALRQQGWSTLALTYGYQSAGDPFSLGALPNMVQEVTAALRAALERENPGWVALVGKSLGAALVATLATSVPELESASLLYLTPPLDVPLFGPVFAETRQRSMIVIGTADRFFDREVLERMRSQRTFELLEVEGADHSLIVAGDPAQTFRVLERVVGAAVDFLKG